MKMRYANLQVYEKNFFKYLLRTDHDYFFRRGFDSVRAKKTFRKYKQKVVLLVIYLFNYDSSKSTSFMLKWHLACLEYGFCQINWNLLQKHY